MSQLLLHQRTQAEVTSFVNRPSHALVLSGPPGSGKLSIAHNIGEELLGLRPGALSSYAYARVLSPADGKTIGIEAVRELEHFLSLKVPTHQAIKRVVIVADAHTMTTEAQNALLKTIEEPPVGTILLLTAASEQALLPTIRSRVQHIGVKRPGAADLQAFFQKQNFPSDAIKRALSISGGLPGLTSALLHDAEHPLLPATQKARELLGLSTFERLTHIDELAQDRALCQDTLFILQQMALISLRTASGQVAQRWQAVLAATYNTHKALQGGAQPKLALCNFFLSI